MIQAHRDAREDVYFKKLRELVPVLKRISASCRVIWLSQYPTINEFARTGDIRTDVHSEKIWHYDQQAASTLTY